MKAVVYPSKAEGIINAIPSKSMAHRLLICAALTEGVTRIRCTSSSEDIDATIGCLRVMGSNVVKIGNYYIVPKITATPCQSIVFDCKESGTTLRFMMCIAAGIGLRARFVGSDRLFERPLSPLEEVLTEHGIVISRDESGRIIQSGKAFGENYNISGNVSSQFISGLLMMLPLCKGVSVTVTGEFESKPYVDLTVGALKQADLNVSVEDRKYTVTGRYDMRDTSVEGDWSNSAFFLCASTLGFDVAVQGLDTESLQGDKELLSVLKDFGADVHIERNKVSCVARKLKGIEIDAKNIPDLVPVLSVVVALAEGKTTIKGAARLKFKESDRLRTVCDMINALGGNCEVFDDGLVIEGVKMLTGGMADACNDHRIAMSAAIAALKCEGPVEIKGAEAVNKSYPNFFEDLRSLGVKVEVEE
ncbi:MAG: 3-phosphoshikimate 1-carboxyvinyltransferase [Ruminococcus sp.]|nr:3-phosphoshikimate 1-carboxyvinyltransferase [Ruminococcus sp.]